MAVLEAILAVGKVNDAAEAGGATDGQRVGTDRMLAGLTPIQLIGAPNPVHAGIRIVANINANNVKIDLDPGFHDSLLCAGVDGSKTAQSEGLYFTFEDKQGCITTSRFYNSRTHIQGSDLAKLRPENLELIKSVVLIIDEKAWKENNTTYDLDYHDDPLTKSEWLGTTAIFHPWALYEKMQLDYNAQVKQIAMLSDKLALMETKATGAENKVVDAEKKVAEAEKKVAEAEKKVKETDRELRRVKEHKRDTVADLKRDHKRDLGNLEKQLDDERTKKGGLQAALEDSDK